jgi:outer membrane biosynthesis protein TonB
MAAAALRSEERIGLGVALAAHAALVALLLVQRPAAVVMPPDRIEVTISDDVGLTSTSPEPRAQAAPDVAPQIGEPPPPQPEPAPPEPQAEPPKAAPAKPEPRPQPRPEPRPRPKAEPRPQPKAEPRPQPKPEPRPRPKAEPRPQPKAEPRPAPKAAARPAPKAAARPAARPSAAAQPRAAERPTGGSRIGDDFLKGVPGAREAGPTRNPPAQAAGPQVQASLLGAISRALRPHWQGKVPEGADSEKLITVLRWNLNRDGTLSGRPEVVRQEGITAANRPQAARHAEQAIRAVQLAAPFDLPEEHYNTWKRVTIRFDKRLSQ